MQKKWHGGCLCQGLLLQDLGVLTMSP
jgi:hypothetical protein